jgi:high-affinity iron transporter
MSVGVVFVMLSGGVVLADVVTGNAEKGADVYRTYCLNCHGAQGRGDGPVADQLTPRPANLTAEKVQQKSEKDLLAIVREGKPGTSMPAWKGELSDQKMLDVLAYLRGFVK